MMRFESAERWSGLKSFGLVVYRWTENDVEKSEIRCYLSSLELVFNKLVCAGRSPGRSITR